MACLFNFSVITGDPGPSKAPYPLPHQLGGGILIPCRYVMQAPRFIVSDIIDILASSLPEIFMTYERVYMGPASSPPASHPSSPNYQLLTP